MWAEERVLELLPGCSRLLLRLEGEDEVASGLG